MAPIGVALMGIGAFLMYAAYRNVRPVTYAKATISTAAAGKATG